MSSPHRSKRNNKARERHFHELKLDVDVVCGPGEITNAFNAHFIALVKQFSPAHTLAQSLDVKRAIVAEIHCLIQSKGGRFYKPVPSDNKIGSTTNRFALLSPKEAQRKITKALRDAKKACSTPGTKNQSRISDSGDSGISCRPGIARDNNDDDAWEPTPLSTLAPPLTKSKSCGGCDEAAVLDNEIDALFWLSPGLWSPPTGEEYRVLPPLCNVADGVDWVV